MEKFVNIKTPAELLHVSFDSATTQVTIVRESTSADYASTRKLVVLPRVILKAGEKRIRDKVKAALASVHFAPVVVLKSGGELQTEEVGWLEYEEPVRGIKLKVVCVNGLERVKFAVIRGSLDEDGEVKWTTADEESICLSEEAWEQFITTAIPFVREEAQKHAAAATNCAAKYESKRKCGRAAGRTAIAAARPKHGATATATATATAKRQQTRDHVSGSAAEACPSKNRASAATAAAAADDDDVASHADDEADGVEA